MKLSISNIAWSNEYDQEMYRYIRKLGFGGLEIAPTRLFNDPYNHTDDAKIYRKNIMNHYQLEVSSMQSIWFGRTENLFGSNKEREILLKHTYKAIDFANAIGCHNLVFGSPKNRVIKQKEDYKVAISFFRKLGEYALKRDTIISIEANPQLYGTNFINTTNEAFEFVKEISHPGIMVNVDLGTIIENDENINVVLKNIYYVNHIHISEPNLILIKHRKLHNEIAKILKKGKYKNYISIEMKNCEDIKKIKETMKYIKEVFG